MRELLLAFPGAQRALFRKYHIGGCSACGFSPEESLEQVISRNTELVLDDVVAFLESAHEEDRRVMIDPVDLHARIGDPETRLLDIRTREEFEVVRIPGSVQFTQDLMNEILMRWPRDKGVIALIDHRGQRGLDAAAYFEGHGYTNVRALTGGIDAYALEVDRSLARYTLE